MLKMPNKLEHKPGRAARLCLWLLSAAQEARRWAVTVSSVDTQGNKYSRQRDVGYLAFIYFH